MWSACANSEIYGLKKLNLPENLSYTPIVEKSSTWILLKYCHVPKGKDPELYYFASLLPRVREMWDSKLDLVRITICQMFIGEYTITFFLGSLEVFC